MSAQNVSNGKSQPQTPAITSSGPNPLKAMAQTGAYQQALVLATMVEMWSNGHIRMTAILRMNSTKFSENCIYGEDGSDGTITEGFSICEGCKDRIEENINRYNHN